MKGHTTKQLADPWTGQGLLFPVETPSHILPTHTTADRHPFHRWFGFVAGFSPEYVRCCVSEAGLKPGDVILDAFAGCGTTMVEANALGVRSIGFEPHPFLADMCRAKLLAGVDPTWAREIQALLEDAPPEPFSGVFSPAAATFLGKLLPPASLKRLASAREMCTTLHGKKALLAQLIISKVLDLCSHSKTDGIYKAPSSRKAATEYTTALRIICSMVASDLSAAKAAKIRNRSQLFQASSENMAGVKPRSCALLITSPPYLNNFDFAEMTRMYLYFWGYARDWKEISERVRSKLIVNTTTALKGHKERLRQYRDETPVAVRPILDEYQSELSVRRQRKAGKKEYDSLIYPYFAQMTRVMNSAASVLKPHSQVRIILSDAALYGVHIRAHEILGAILEALRYGDVRIRKLRARGTRWVLDKREGSPDGLGEYELAATAPRRSVSQR